ncbi:MAG: FAA hydrolase family protein [Acidimicrobiales bacterium]|nr:fumarylacetoacetate hydrolase family protein [Hyphomonadaceae bacterium]RZV41651.1 MAG: FAA hydrolase family protein [Acidimicrobiales bacterium]
MRLARLEKDGRIFWALGSDDQRTVREIKGSFHEWAPRLTKGEGKSALELSDDFVSVNAVRFLPPVEPVNRVVVAGANYSKHLEEFGVDPVSKPVAFLKAYGALIGANDDIRYPPLTEKLDHEVELVVVIGSDNVDLDNPYDCVLGYTAGNDVSARDLQRNGSPKIGMDLFAAKSQDRTTGLGPWIVTKDEFPNGSPTLKLTLKVNGDVRQDATSGDMTWGVGELIKYVQQISSFRAGDVLFTGSPDGVGDSTGKYIQRGDLIEAEVENIGVLRNRVSD